MLEDLAGSPDLRPTVSKDSIEEEDMRREGTFGNLDEEDFPASQLSPSPGDPSAGQENSGMRLWSMVLSCFLSAAAFSIIG